MKQVFPKLTKPLSPTRRCAGGATSPIPSDVAFSWSAVDRDEPLERLPVVGVVGSDDAEELRGTDDDEDINDGEEVGEEN